MVVLRYLHCLVNFVSTGNGVGFSSANPSEKQERILSPNHVQGAFTRRENFKVLLHIYNATYANLSS